MKNAEPARCELRILRQRLDLSGDRHSVFRFVDCPIHIVKSALTPAALVMLCHRELLARSTQMLQRSPHVRLISAGIVQTKR